jgi:hypothetical protein
MCFEVVNNLLCLVTLEGRMHEGVVCDSFEGWIIFHYTLHPLENYNLTIGIKVYDWGVMKIAKDLESDKVWQTKVLCVMWVWG